MAVVLAPMLVQILAFVNDGVDVRTLSWIYTLDLGKWLGRYYCSGILMCPGPCSRQAQHQLLRPELARAHREDVGVLDLRRQETKGDKNGPLGPNLLYIGPPPKDLY